MTLDKQATEFLVRALAALEAPWAPLRSMDWPAAMAICEARTRPDPASLEGGNARQWKRNQRQRDRLAADGLMVDGFLTAEGKKLARSWCWSLYSADARAAVERIDACRRTRHCLPGGYVPETFIAGQAWGGDVDQIAGLQYALTPLLCDGIAEARSTASGHTFYRLADTLADAQAAVAGLGDFSQWRKDLADKYHAHRRAVRDQFRRDVDYRQDIGEIPLALDALQSKRSYDNLKGFPPLFTVDAA